MRESVGGALLIKLIMFFIAIYICFLAITINYSITFRVKNQIINLIEEYEGYENAKSYIDEYIGDIGYYRDTTANNIPRKVGCENGYCIQKLDGERGPYYRVTAYVSFSFPIIGKITNLPIAGETRVIYKLKV